MGFFICLIFPCDPAVSLAISVIKLNKQRNMKNRGISNLVMLSIGVVILIAMIFFLNGNQVAVPLAEENGGGFPTSKSVGLSPTETGKITETAPVTEEATVEPIPLPVKKSPFSISGAWDAIFGGTKSDAQTFEELKKTLIPTQVQPTATLKPVAVETPFDKTGRIINDEEVYTLVYQDGGAERRVVLAFDVKSLCQTKEAKNLCVNFNNFPETGDAVRTIGVTEGAKVRVVTMTAI